MEFLQNILCCCLFTGFHTSQSECENHNTNLDEDDGLYWKELMDSTFDLCAQENGNMHNWCVFSFLLIVEDCAYCIMLQKLRYHQKSRSHINQTS